MDEEQCSSASSASDADDSSDCEPTLAKRHRTADTPSITADSPAATSSPPPAPISIASSPAAPPPPRRRKSKSDVSAIKPTAAASPAVTTATSAHKRKRTSSKTTATTAETVATSSIKKKKPATSRASSATGSVQREAVKNAQSSSSSSSSAAAAAAAGRSRIPKPWPYPRELIPQIEGSDSEDFCTRCREAGRDAQEEEGELIRCDGVCGCAFHPPCLTVAEFNTMGDEGVSWYCQHCARGEWSPGSIADFRAGLEWNEEKSEPTSGSTVLMSSLSIWEKPGRDAFIKHLCTLPAVRHSVSTNLRDFEQRTVLHLCAQKQAPSWLTLLFLQIGADPNLPDIYGNAAAHRAFSDQAIPTLLALLTSPSIDLWARAGSVGHAVFANCGEGAIKGKRHSGLGPGLHTQGTQGYFCFQLKFAFAIIHAAREELILHKNWKKQDKGRKKPVQIADSDDADAVVDAAAVADATRLAERDAFFHFFQDRLQSLSPKLLQFVFTLLIRGAEAARAFSSATFLPPTPAELALLGLAVRTGRKKVMTVVRIKEEGKDEDENKQEDEQQPEGERKEEEQPAEAVKTEYYPTARRSSTSRSPLFVPQLALVILQHVQMNSASSSLVVGNRVTAAEAELEQWINVLENECPEFVHLSKTPEPLKAAAAAVAPVATAAAAAAAKAKAAAKAAAAAAASASSAPSSLVPPESSHLSSSSPSPGASASATASAAAPSSSRVKQEVPPLERSFGRSSSPHTPLRAGAAAAAAAAASASPATPQLSSAAAARGAPLSGASPAFSSSAFPRGLATAPSFSLQADAFDMEDSGAGGGDDSFMQDDRHSAFARSPPLRRRASDAALHDLTADATNDEAALPSSSSAAAHPTDAFDRLFAAQAREREELAQRHSQQLKALTEHMRKHGSR